MIGFNTTIDNTGDYSVNLVEFGQVTVGLRQVMVEQTFRKNNFSSAALPNGLYGQVKVEFWQIIDEFWQKIREFGQIIADFGQVKIEFGQKALSNPDVS